MGCCCSKNNYEEDGHIRFRVIDGRRYHNISNSEYFVANDGEEADRLRRYHDALKTIWGGLFHSPIEEKLKKGARVIDLGCGTGTWLLDMSRHYPKSHFIGIDFSPIFPTENLPPNVEFIQYNILDGLPFTDSNFDFVHQKFMVAAFTQAQWKEKVIPECLRLTRPGGWIEFVESDAILMSDGNATQRIANAIQSFMSSKGLNHKIGEDIPRLLEITDAFTEIRNKKKPVTLGKKGGRPGQETLIFLTRGMNTIRVWLSGAMNIMPEHYDALVEAISFEAEKTHTYVNQYRICGRKKDRI
ncbi:1610_t:CDS:2 [Ambispora gerdemannii]|uniref:1610_t:CDS:1 n=1 Tax=Ambispora gerdemannii TaxID=144530 RepID=A0A9N9AQU7_9GLOM|nr:1610_t:CDS:2 [Ambispora gerdemannii]